MKMPSVAAHAPRGAAFAALTLAGSVAGFSQAAVDVSSGSKPNDAVVLSPFLVNEDNDQGYLSKNTISGTGTNETITKIPQTIQIANQQLIQDLRSDDPMEAIETVSASATRRSFNPGDDTFIWGFRLQSSLKDSLPYTTNAIGTLYDVDRIEVIKGPAAMMFGQNSYTGGVINYVTRRPTATQQLSALVSIGSFDYRSFVVHASGPVVKGLRYRVDAGTTDSKYSARKFGRIKDRFIGGGVEYDISSKTMLSADFSYGTSDSVRPKTFIDPVTLKLIDMPDDYTTILPWQKYPITQARGKAVLTSALSPYVDSRTFVGYNNSTNDWLRDLISSVNPTAHTLAKTAAHFVTTGHFISFGQDFVVKLNTGPLHHKLIFGGDQRNDTSDQSSASTTLSTPNWNYLNPVYDAVPTTTIVGTPTETAITSRTSGAYVQEQISMWDDRVKLLGGMRYNNFFQSSGKISAFLGPATVSEGSKTISRFGFIVQPIPRQDITLYYNRSQSFLFNGGVDYLNNPLKPSVGVNNEVGVKTMLFNGSVSLSATYFDIDLTNVRVVFTEGPNDPSPGASAAKQDGKQTNKGYDLSAGVSRDLGSGVVNLIASVYGGNTMNELHVKPAAAVNHTYSILATYGIKQGLAKNLKFGAGYLYKGERIIPVATGFAAGTVIKGPAYDVVRSFASYSLGHYSLQLNVDNLFNKIYVQGAESAVWIQTDPGRVVKATLNYRF